MSSPGLRSSELAASLIRWYERARRDLPWRRTSDPYRILVSEVMLQQTRAHAVIPYYEKFLRRFPSAEALAAAPESEVLACWSGLGYYSRARNLRLTAIEIVRNGGFPKDYADIRRLKGVGDYTAAAVASIAFNLPYAVVDGNVLRVIARVRNDASDIGRGATRKRFQEIANEWIDPARPGDFNQAIMELGATVCLPRDPQCLLCPIAHLCQARIAGSPEALPVKVRKGVAEKIECTILIVRRGKKVLMKQRAGDAKRLAGFWELPLSEDLPGVEPLALVGMLRHTIVHQQWRVAVYSAAITRAPRGFQWIPVAEEDQVPLTTIARKALRLSEIKHIPL